MVQRSSKAILKAVTVPGGILLLGVTALVYSGWLTLAQPALNFLYYCALIGGMLLAWRFHSSRAFFALLVLFLAEQTISVWRPEHGLAGAYGSVALQVVAIIVPMNFVLIALMHERGFSVPSAAPLGLLLFIGSVLVVVLSHAAAEIASPLPRPHHLAKVVPLPGYTFLLYAAASIFLLGRLVLTHKLIDGALLWSLVAFLQFLRFSGTARISTVYAATAACILAVSIIEDSYLLAYHDELTALPSRRAFNDAMLRLQDPFSIAVVDIDHFKHFNDTHGHDTGDQVLRLVASNLSRVTGGGQTYRCGGEEFTILFPGKTSSEVGDHLERLRGVIERSEFHMRNQDRRQVARGPDRRNERTRGRARKAHAIRQLSQERSPARLHVTVSIGVASSTAENPLPDLILQAADKALYRAKANGRNRVEVASAGRQRRVKAAGIA